MFRVQTGMCLKNFGSESEYNTDVIKIEQLIQMLIDVGYIKDKDDFRDGKIEEVKEKINGLNYNDVVSAILNSPEIYTQDEINSIYQILKKYSCVSQNKKQAHINQIKQEKNNNWIMNNSRIVGKPISFLFSFAKHRS